MNEKLEKQWQVEGKSLKEITLKKIARKDPYSILRKLNLFSLKRLRIP
jgi:hypothetical protein